MPTATVNSSRCKRDGVCVATCPMGVLELDGEKLPRVAAGKGELCVRCGHCVAVCKQAALTLDAITPESCVALRGEVYPSVEQIGQLVQRRRSIRVYQDKKVPREVLGQILHLASWAPTAKNCQVVSWLAVDEAEKLRKLTEMVVDCFRPNPTSARIVEAWKTGQDRVLRHAPLLLIAHAPTASFCPQVDCTIALAHVDLLASGFGLGACWAGLFMIGVNNHAPLREALGLPEGHGAYGALMMGYPRVGYARIPPRKQAEVRWL